ncbi:hypothetical protein [Paenibacillus dendritiformis]|uniref:hypothetical protein n=1 Tax=Paenibacillus dendritiformis TaxID=130049 RepID=UPI0018CEFD69|nr:hypothetical protein [Paenibacillus dendritiformis]
MPKFIKSAISPLKIVNGKLKVWTGDKFFEYKVGQKMVKESFKNGIQGLRESLENMADNNKFGLKVAPAGGYIYSRQGTVKQPSGLTKNQKNYWNVMESNSGKTPQGNTKGASRNEIDDVFISISKSKLSKDGEKIMSKTTKKGVVKEEYIFENKNEAQNFGKKLIGRDGERIYDESGKWIGWEGKKGKVYWGHNDWGKGAGLSNFPHINYDLYGVKGHLFLKNKIINRKMWDSFTRELTEEMNKKPK